MANINLIQGQPDFDVVGNPIAATTRSVVRELGPTDNRFRETVVPEVNMPEGSLVYQKTSGPSIGLAALASAAAVATANVVGFLLRPGRAGTAVGVITIGKLAGFDLSSVPVGTPVYLSDTPGRLSTTRGTIGVCVGSIRQLNDEVKTKYIAVFIPLNQDPKAP